MNSFHHKTCQNIFSSQYGLLIWINLVEEANLGYYQTQIATHQPQQPNPGVPPVAENQGLFARVKEGIQEQLCHVSPKLVHQVVNQASITLTQNNIMYEFCEILKPKSPRFKIPTVSLVIGNLCIIWVTRLDQNFFDPHHNVVS